MTPAPISVDGAPAKVHRYDPRITPNLKTGRVDYDGMAAFPNGKWVLHSDYAALLQQLAEREADLEREQGVREDAQRQLRVALNDLHDMRWMYAQELKRAEAAERAREEACGLLRDIRPVLSCADTYGACGDLRDRIAAFLAAGGDSHED